MQTLTLDSRPRQLPMKVRSCGSQPANISLINRREGVSVSAHARVRKRRDGKKHSGLINPASAEAHHISRFPFFLLALSGRHTAHREYQSVQPDSLHVQTPCASEIRGIVLVLDRYAHIPAFDHLH